MVRTANPWKLTKALARKVLGVVDKGLTRGLGKPEPGKMCVEAAICYAFGWEHGDDPECVTDAVRDYKVQVNDQNWSSKAARAKGMRRAAVAQLGSESLKEGRFQRRVIRLSASTVLPPVVLAVADYAAEQGYDVTALRAAAGACAKRATLGTIRRVYVESGGLNDKVPYHGLRDERTLRGALYNLIGAAEKYVYSYEWPDDAPSGVDRILQALPALATAYATVRLRSGVDIVGEHVDHVFALSAEVCVQACVMGGTRGSKFLALTEV